MEEKKRIRSKNFTEREKDELINIVEKYREIVENKRIDAASLRVKNDAWNNIVHEYNSIQVTGLRNKAQLHLLLKDLKKAARNNIMHDKLETMKTSGQSINLRSTDRDIQINNIDPVQIVELNNPFGVENIKIEVEEMTDTSNYMTEDRTLTHTPCSATYEHSDSTDTNPMPKKRKNIREMNNVKYNILHTKKLCEDVHLKMKETEWEIMMERKKREEIETEIKRKELELLCIKIKKAQKELED